MENISHSPSTPSLPNNHENIFLFIPNLIGYSRVLLAIASLHYMPLHPRTCCFLYTVSCALDAADGWAARQFNQATKFGAVLDMVTDRCTTACLLVFLASAFPRFSFIFQCLISLDLASHYIHMYATLVMGGSHTSHKTVDQHRSSILKLYYSNSFVLFTFCALNELFFISLYLLSFSSPMLSPQLLSTAHASISSTLTSPALQTSSTPLINTPSSFIPPKSSSYLLHPWSAGAMELARANKLDSTVPWILASICFPVMAAKQVINVIQLFKASRWLAEGDVRQRSMLKNSNPSTTCHYLAQPLNQNPSSSTKKSE